MDFEDGKGVVGHQVMACHGAVSGRCGKWRERFKKENPDGKERVWADSEGGLFLCWD